MIEGLKLSPQTLTNESRAWEAQLNFTKQKQSKLQFSLFFLKKQVYFKFYNKKSQKERLYCENI